MSCPEPSGRDGQKQDWLDEIPVRPALKVKLSLISVYDEWNKTDNVYQLDISLYQETGYSIVKAYVLLPHSARQCTLVPLYLLWGCPDNVGISRTGFADGPPCVTYSADRVCVVTTVKSGYAGNPYIAYRAVE